MKRRILTTSYGRNLKQTLKKKEAASYDVDDKVTDAIVTRKRSNINGIRSFSATKQNPNRLEVLPSIDSNGPVENCVCCIHCEVVVNGDEISQHCMSTFCQEQKRHWTLTAVTVCPLCRASCGRVRSLFIHFDKFHNNDADVSRQSFEVLEAAREFIANYNNQSGYRMIVNIPLKKTKKVPFIHYVCNRASNRCSTNIYNNKRSMDSRVVRLGARCSALALIVHFESLWHLILYSKHNHMPALKPEARSYVNPETGKREKRFVTVSISPNYPILRNLLDPDYKRRMTAEDARIVDEIIDLQITPTQYAEYSTKQKGYPISRTTVSNIINQAFSQSQQARAAQPQIDNYSPYRKVNPAREDRTHYATVESTSGQLIPTITLPKVTFQLKSMANEDGHTEIALFDDDVYIGDQLTTVCELLTSEESMEADVDTRSLLADARRLVEEAINRRSQQTTVIYEPIDQQTIHGIREERTIL